MNQRRDLDRLRVSQPGIVEGLQSVRISWPEMPDQLLYVAWHPNRTSRVKIKNPTSALQRPIGTPIAAGSETSLFPAVEDARFQVTVVQAFKVLNMTSSTTRMVC